MSAREAPAVEVIWTPRPPDQERDRRLAELLFAESSSRPEGPQKPGRLAG